MERSREFRRGGMTAVHGILAKRKKQRTSTAVLRDYHEDGVMEMNERLRDRKDRDRDGERPRKRRRPERVMNHHGGGHKDYMEESADEAVEDDEAVLMPLRVNHDRPMEPLRLPPWDHITVSIPKKARTRGTVKRSHDPRLSGAGGGGEQSQRQFSTSAGRSSPSSAHVSPSRSENQSPAEMPKDSSTDDELEIAEFLCGMGAQEDTAVEVKDMAVKDLNSEGKAPLLAANSVSHRLPDPSSSSPLTAVAVQRKRPRIKHDQGPSISTVLALPSTWKSSEAMMAEDKLVGLETVSPSKGKLVPSLPSDNVGSLRELPAFQAIPACVVTEQPRKSETLSVSAAISIDSGKEYIEEVVLPRKEAPPADLDKVTATVKITPAFQSLRKDNFTIDLMALPDTDGLCDLITEERAVAHKLKLTEKSIPSEEIDSKQLPKGRKLDLQIDLENSDGIANNKEELPNQSFKASKVDPHSDQTVPSSLPILTTGGRWPVSFPQLGYMGQVPTLQAIMPATTRSSNVPPPPVRQKRGSTHCYVAQCIQYHQKIMQANAFLHASAGSGQLLGPNPPTNHPVMPPLDAVLGNPFQGNGRSAGYLQDTKGAPIFAALTGYPSNTNIPEAPHKTQLDLQKKSSGFGLADNVIPSTALLYPINQHQVMAAVAAVQSGVAAKSSVPVCPPSGISISGMGCSGPATPSGGMNFGYSPEQYLSILQNSRYAIHIPAHPGGPPSYRGFAPSTAMPLFGGPRYQSQMLHHPQLQQNLLQQQQELQQRQQKPVRASELQRLSHRQPGHQNMNTSSGSSSSQQVQWVPGGEAKGTDTTLDDLPSKKQQPQPQNYHARQKESESVCEKIPSSEYTRASQAEKSLCDHNMAMPAHLQNTALFFNATAAPGLSIGVRNHEKQSAVKPNITPSQAFTMSFASNNAGGSLSDIDHSSMAQCHAFFQSLPQMARNQYQMPMTAGVPELEQQKKVHSMAVEGDKLNADSSNTDNVDHGERKDMNVTLKSCRLNDSPQSSSSKPDKEHHVGTFISNKIVERPSNTQSNISAFANGSRISTQPVTAITPKSASTPSTPNFQQFQLLRQQQLQKQQHIVAASAKSSTSSNNASVYSGSTMANFPQTLAGFPQILAQSGSAPQPHLCKTNARMNTSAPTGAVDPFLAGNYALPQARSSLTSSHNAQMSFRVNKMKTASAVVQHLPANGSSTVAPSATGGNGSPSNSFSRSTSSSPRANEKPTTQDMAQAFPPQSCTKSSASNSSHKSSRCGNVSSNLSCPQLSNPATNSSNGDKQLPQMQQFHLQSHQHMQKYPHVFFSSAPYIRAQAPQSISAAGSTNFYRQQGEQKQSQQEKHQRQSSNSASSDLTLASSAAPSDGSKAGTATANTSKKMASPGLLHAAQAVASAVMLPCMPLPSISAKPGDQKPAA